MEFFELDLKVLDGFCSNANVIGVAVVVVCGDGGCVFMWLIGRAVSSASDGDLS